MKDSILLSVALPSALAIIMFGMGLSLVLTDFKRIIKYPKAIILGLTNQIVILPIISFILCLIFSLSPEMSIGLMILSACPGGPTSNLITYMSKGDTALSISMTAISSFITVFTIPFIVTFALYYFTRESETKIEISIVDTIIKVMLITIIPVSLGMSVKRMNDKLALRIEKRMKIVSMIIFILVIAGIIIINQDKLVSSFREVGFVTLTLNIITMAIGYYSAKIFLLNTKQVISITVETGIQNATLAIVIATSIIGEPIMSIPSAVYALLMYFTGTFMMLMFGKRKNRS